MKNFQEIVKNLSKFNNMNFTKEQWDIILTGCGCPKGNNFWTALRNLCMWNSNKQYYLTDIDDNTLKQVFESYTEINRTYSKKYIKKTKAKIKVEEWRKNYTSTTLYVVNGTITIEKPEYDY